MFVKFKISLILSAAIIFFLSGILAYSYCYGETSLIGSQTGDEAVIAEEKLNPPAPAREESFRQSLKQLITEGSDMPHQLDTSFKYMPLQSVKSQDGEVAINEVESEYSYDLKIAGKLPVELSLYQQYIDINESTAVPLPSKLTGVSAGIQTTFPFFNIDKTYFRLRLIPSFYSDRWSFNSGNFRLPVHMFVIHQPSDKLTLLAGVGIYPDYADNVVPIFGFIYKPTDKLTFNIVPIRANISYDLTDKLSLFTVFDATSDEYLVRKDGVKNVTLYYKQRFLGAGLSYEINKNVTVSLSGGNVFGRVLEYKDYQGKVSIKNGLYTEFRLELSA